MQAKVAAAPAALELIAEIVAEHGPVLFHQSEQGRRRCNLYLPTMILNLLIGTRHKSDGDPHVWSDRVTHAMGHLVARFRMHGRRSRIVAMIAW